MWESGPDKEHKDKNVSGLANNGSRWGVKGSSEISDGLTAVYQFERKIDATDASSTSGRLSYAGVSGGFGTLTMGRLWSASYNHIGGIQDIGNAHGGGDFTGRTANTISYAVSVGSVSFQADIQANKGGGMSNKERQLASTATGENDSQMPLAGSAGSGSTVEPDGVEDKSVDSGQFGATLALGESGKIAVAYIKDDAMKHEKNTKAFVMGQYSIGGMNLHLGMGQHKHDDRAFSAGPDDRSDGNDNVSVNQTKKVETIYAGASGGLGDTGVSFNVSFKNIKTSGKVLSEDVDGDGMLRENSTDIGLVKREADKHSPWVIGLSRSLGGGATVYFEHMNADQDKTKNSSAIGLKVNF